MLISNSIETQKSLDRNSLGSFWWNIGISIKAMIKDQLRRFIVCTHTHTRTHILYLVLFRWNYSTKKNILNTFWISMICMACHCPFCIKMHLVRTYTWLIRNLKWTTKIFYTKDIPFICQPPGHNVQSIWIMIIWIKFGGIFMSWWTCRKHISHSEKSDTNYELWVQFNEISHFR